MKTLFEILKATVYAAVGITGLVLSLIYTIFKLLVDGLYKITNTMLSWAQRGLDEIKKSIYGTPEQ